MTLNRNRSHNAITKEECGTGKFLRKFIPPILCAAGVSLLSAQDPAPEVAVPLLSREESAAIDTLTATILKAGFPDTANAEVYTGELTVTSTFDPDDTPPFPSSRSKMQMTAPDSSGVTHSYQFDGLHFKLPDGTWLISLTYRYKEKPGDQVKSESLTAINPAELTADAAREKPFDAEKEAAEWLENIAPAHKTRSVAEMNRLVPVMNRLSLSLDDLAPAVVLLARAGWSEANALSLPIASQRARKYWQLRPWNGPEFPFDPTGKYPDAPALEKAWRKEHPLFSPEDPGTAFRRAMFRWSRAQITVENPEDAFLSPAVAAAVAKDLVDPKDPQGNLARIDALLAGSAIRVTPAEDSGLAARLQSWEAREREPRMVVRGGKADDDNPSISTSFIAPAPAYVPEKGDLDALAALLDDERPSRFQDFAGPHPVGDNALRAMTILLKADPRKLAGLSADVPWTRTARGTAAKAVQKWWKEHRTEYLEQ